MIEWFNNTRVGKWINKHPWAKKGMFAFLAFELIKSLAWIAFFVAVWLGYKK